MSRYPAPRSRVLLRGRGRMLAGLLAAGVALATAGCGSNSDRVIPAPPPTPVVADLPAADIVSSAQRALATAASVHVTGDLRVGSRRVQADVRIAAGRRATGTVTTDGVRVEIRRLGDRLYLRGDEPFLAALGPKAVATKGRWLVAPSAAKADPGLAGVTDLDRFAAALSPGGGALTKEPVQPLAGVPAVALRSATGARLFVAAQGPARPLRLQRTGTAAGVLDFTDYNAKVDVVAPTGAVDLASVTR